MNKYLTKLRSNLVLRLASAAFLSYVAFAMVMFGVGFQIVVFPLGISMALFISSAFDWSNVMQQWPKVSVKDLRELHITGVLELDETYVKTKLAKGREIDSFDVYRHGLAENGEISERSEQRESNAGGQAGAPPVAEEPIVENEETIEQSEEVSEPQKAINIVDVPDELKGTHEGIALKSVFEKDMPLRVPYYSAESEAFFMRISETLAMFLGTKSAKNMPEGLLYDITKGQHSVQRVVKDQYYQMVAEDAGSAQ